MTMRGLIDGVDSGAAFQTAGEEYVKQAAQQIIALKTKLRELSEDRGDIVAELEAGTLELTTLRDEVKTLRAELEAANLSRDDLRGEVSLLRRALDRAKSGQGAK